MRTKLSLLATAATAAMFLAAGPPAGAAPDGASGRNAEDAAPVLLTGGLVGPLHVSAGRDGSVTVSESFAGRLTRVDSGGNHDVLYETPDWSVAGNAQRGDRTYFLESQEIGRASCRERVL